jgi:hypothetical protein
LDIFKYCWENDCDFMEELLLLAPMHGHVEIIKYLHENKILTDENASDSFSGALMGNSVPVLEYMKENEIFCKPTSPARYLFENIEIFEEVFSEKSDEFDSEEFWTQCAAAGRVDFFRLLKKKFPNFELDLMGIVSAAVLRGDKDVLKWVREEGGWEDEERDPADCPVVFSAIIGKYELFKWLLDNGWEWNYHASIGAATGGCLKVLEVREIFLPNNFLIPIGVPCTDTFFLSLLLPTLRSSLPVHPTNLFLVRDRKWTRDLPQQDI